MSLFVRPIVEFDASAMLDFFQQLVVQDPERVERAQEVLGMSVDMERSWIQKRLKEEMAGERFALCADAGGGIVAVGEVERLKRWYERHVAEIRFGILPGHAQAGLELVRALAGKAAANGIEILVRYELSTQQTGLEVARQAGFEEAGRVPGYYRRPVGDVDRVCLTQSLLPR